MLPPALGADNEGGGKHVEYVVVKIAGLTSSLPSFADMLSAVTEELVQIGGHPSPLQPLSTRQEGGGMPTFETLQAEPPTIVREGDEDEDTLLESVDAIAAACINQPKAAKAAATAVETPAKDTPVPRDLNSKKVVVPAPTPQSSNE